MRNYEVAFIVQSELEQSAFDELIEKVKSWIIDTGGSITNVDLWGIKTLAYPIRKQTEGQYVIMETQMASDVCAILERNLGLQEQILRYLVINTEV